MKALTIRKKQNKNFDHSLYESIMRKVSKELKSALKMNEDEEIDDTYNNGRGGEYDIWQDFADVKNAPNEECRDEMLSYIKFAEKHNLPMVEFLDGIQQIKDKYYDEHLG